MGPGLTSRKGLGSKVFDLFILIFMLIAIFLCLMPILNIIAISLSDSAHVQAGKVGIWPIGTNVMAFRELLVDKTLLRTLFYSIGLTLLYVALSLIITVMLAYPLSKRNLRGRTFFFVFIVITMYIGGGLIPTYMLYRDIGILDTIWVLTLPGILSTFNMLVIKTYFTTSIPESLEESAMLDGASHIGTLLRIVIPLSKPVLATIALFCAVGRWNSFMDSLIYITRNVHLRTIQFRLYEIVVNKANLVIDPAELARIDFNLQEVASESLKAAVTIYTMLPILLVYPFLQKYFVGGMTIGAVKG